MSEIKLKPCPFCGGMAYLGVDYENSAISTMFHDYIYFIKCQSCGAVIYGAHGRKEISDKWNRREVNRMRDNSKVIIHDQFLEFESNIWESVEQLGDQRVKNYETGRIEDIDLIIPILNDISNEVERYKEYIREVRNE